MNEQLNIAINKGATMPVPPTLATTRTIASTRGKVGRLDHEGSCRFYVDTDLTLLSSVSLSRAKNSLYN